MLTITLLLSTYPLFAEISDFDTSSLIPNANAVTRSVYLNGTFSGWNISTSNPNPSIVVTQGDTVNLSLHSGEGALHLFYVDINRDGSRTCPQEKCSTDFGGGFPIDTSFSFDADFASGEYMYYCPYHPPMQGSFIVQGFTITTVPSSLRVVQGFSNASTITVTSINSFSGTVGLSATSLPGGLTPSMNPPSVSLSPSGTETSILTLLASDTTPVGNYNINVTGTSGSSYFTKIVPTLVVPPDFSISATPSTLVIQLGSARNSTITLSSLDTFSGNVVLSTDPLPAGMIATLNPASINVPSGGNANSTLDVSVSPTFAMPGTYKVNVTGTGGSLTHTVTVTVVAGPDFDMSVSPATLTLTPGSSGASTITVASFNNFTGTVDLTGSPANGQAVSINPPSIPLSSGGTATANLNVSISAMIAAGNYTVTVTAVSGSKVHLAVVTISVMDFKISVSNTNLTIRQGLSATSIVSVSSLNRFVGVVSLTTTASSNALSSLLNVTTISLSPSGTGFAILTMSASSVPAGTYSVTLTGASGSLVRTLSLTITVQSLPDGASLLPTVGGIAAGTIAIASAGLYFMRRRSLRKRASSRTPSP